MPRPIQEGEPVLTQTVNERFLNEKPTGKSLRERLHGVITPVHPPVSIGKKEGENGQS